MVKGKRVSPKVKRNILFGVIVKEQIRKSYHEEGSRKKRRKFLDKISGYVIKKYRCLDELKTVTSKRLLSMIRTPSVYHPENRTLSRKKEQWLNYSTGTSIPDTITRCKIKMQMRF